MCTLQYAMISQWDITNIIQLNIIKYNKIIFDII